MRSDLDAPFSLDGLRYGDEPLPLGPYRAAVPAGVRVNHWLLKNHDDAALQSFPVVDDFVARCTLHLDAHGLSHLWRGRYAYLTIDTAPVAAGCAQRSAGWHLDGMQGDERPVKVAPDIAFVWCSHLPTRFLRGGIDLGGLDPSTHDVFSALTARIDPRRTFTIACGTIYLIHAYMPHTAELAPQVVAQRTFIRLSFSLAPITSRKLTLNPGIRYNYRPHTTSGEIPAHLKPAPGATDSAYDQ